MSKNKMNIEENVMKQIKEGKVRMHPKIYFILGTILGYFGVLAAAFSATFFINVLLFSLEHTGPRAGYRIDYMVSVFPLWVFIPVFVLVPIGLISIAKSDLYYKHRKKLLMGLLVSITFGVLITKLVGFDKLWEKRYPLRLRRYYKQEQLGRERKNMREYQENRINRRQFSE